jgi:hypothetical protein
MLQDDRRHNLLWKYVPGTMHLQQHFIALPAPARRLLPALIVGQLLVKKTGALTTTDRVEPVDTKIFDDEIPVDLEAGDQAPFAEALRRYQQDE